LLEEMRKVFLYACAVREGAEVHGTKRGIRYLRPDEHEIMAKSYTAHDSEAVNRLARSYVNCLTALLSKYGIEADAARLNATLSEVL
jgi:hypothetical protein